MVTNASKVAKGGQGTKPESRFSRWVSIGFILVGVAVGIQSAATAAAMNPLGGSSDSASSNNIAAAANLHVSFPQSSVSTARETRGHLTAIRVTGIPAEHVDHEYQVIVGKSDKTSTTTLPVLCVLGQSAIDLPLPKPVDPEAIVFVTVTAN